MYRAQDGRLRRLLSPSLGVAAFVFAASACNTDLEDPAAAQSAVVATPATPAGALNASDAPGARLGVYRAFWPTRTDTELAARVNTLVGVLRATPPKLVSPERLRDTRSAPFDDPQLQVSYKDQFDDVTVRDLSLLPGEKPGPDVGEAVARGVAAKAIKSLVDAGLAVDGHFNPTEFATGHHRRGQYAGDGSAVQSSVVEYRFRALRKLNGIDVANSGVVVGVSPSGKVSSMRLGGAQIESVVDANGEAPTSAGRIFTRVVATASIERRFANEVAPGVAKNVLAKSLMYVVPRKAASSLIEPTVVFRYGQTFGTGAHSIVTPAKTVGYSVEDPTKSPRDLDVE